MSAHFEVARSRDGEWFARYVARNGRELFRTSETYTRKAGVENAIASISGCPLVKVDGLLWAHRCKDDVEVREVGQ